MGIIWGVAVLFGILSGVLLTGKGGFLIAGYNTSSKAEKAKYDEKKLCRTMGIGMSVITLMLFVMAILGDNVNGIVAGISMGVIILDIIFMLFWSNTKCYATDADGQRIVLDEKAMKEEKANKKMTMVVSIILAVVFVFVGILLMTGDIKIRCAENQIQVVASYYRDCEINYEDITDVTFSDSNIKGSRVNGFGSFKLAMGRFEDKNSFGRYTRYTYISGEACIVINTKEDGIYVLNCKTDEATKGLYEEINTKLQR